MDKIILSLKNIYKLLMANDFPVYSESVIGEKERKGQTVIRFWQHMLAEEFKSLPCGKMIWRYTEKRNRYTSQLCNRSMAANLYARYAKELAAQLNREHPGAIERMFGPIINGNIPIWPPRHTCANHSKDK